MVTDHLLLDDRYAAAVLADTPSAYWRLGEASGVLQDATGAAPMVNGGGSPTYSTLGLIGGDADTAIAFHSATSDWFSAPDQLALQTGNGPFTIEGWTKRTVAGVRHVIYSKGTGAPLLEWTAGNVLQLVRDNQLDLVTSSTAHADTNAHHVVVTYAGSNGNVSFYVDGILEGSSTVACNFIESGFEAAIAVDRINTNNYFNGTLDEIALYKYALSAVQVTNHYQTGLGVVSGNYLLEDSSGDVLIDAAKYSAVVLADNPVAYYRLGEAPGSTVAVDSSVSGLNGTYVGNPALGQDKALTADPDTGVELNGNSQLITIADNNLLDLGDVVSVEAWIRRTGDHDLGTIICKGGAYTLQIDDYTAPVILWRQDVGTIHSHSSISIPADNIWHHIVATKSGSSRHVYVDAVDVTLLDTNVTLGDSSSALEIGRQQTGSTRYWQGSIDEVAVYNHELTLAQVQAHYAAARRPYETLVRDDSPVAYYRLGETAGHSLDYGPNHLDTFVEFAPTRGAAGALTADDADTAITFDGTTSYLQVANAAAINVGDVVTMEAWLKPTAVTAAAQRTFITKGHLGAYQASLNTDGTVSLVKSQTAVIATSTIPLPNATQYHHVVITKNGASVHIYINGVDVTGAVTNATLVNESNDLTIGREPIDGEFFAGSIDEVSIYNYALTPQQVYAHYLSGIFAGTQTLVRTAAESRTQADVATRTLIAARTVTQTITQGDVATVIVQRFRTATESCTQADVATVTKFAVRSATESRTQADVATRSGGFVRSATEANTQADAAVRGALSLNRTTTESRTQADVATRAGGFTRSATESGTQADVATRTSALTRSATEANTQADAAVAQKTVTRTATESRTQADVATRTLAASRSTSEANTQADSAVRTITETRTAADSGTQADAATRTTVLFRSTSEANTQADTATRAISETRTATEANTQADTATRTGTFSRSTTEANTQADSATGLKTINRSATESRTQADVATRLLVASRSTTEANTQSDVATRAALNLSRTATESRTQADVATRTLIAVRSVSEANTQADTVARTLILSRSASDAGTQADSATRLLVLSRSATESRTQADTATVTKAATRSTTEANTQADSATRQLIAFRTATESRAQSDAATVNAANNYTTSESVTQADTATRAFSGTRSSTEANTQSDAATDTKAAVRSTTESRTQADAATRTLAATRSTSEAVTQSDTATRGALNLSRSTTESRTQADSASRQLVLSRAAADGSSVADAVVRILAEFRTATDAATASDVATVPTGNLVNRTATESRTMADAATRSLASQRSTAESPTSADAATRTANLSRSTAESRAQADSAVRAVAKFLTASESRTQADVATRTLAGVRSATESPTWVDNATRTANFFRSNSNTVTQSDAAVGSKAKTASCVDHITASESITTLRNLTRSGAEAITWVDSPVRTGTFSRTTTDVASATDAVSESQHGFISDGTSAYVAVRAKRSAYVIARSKSTAGVVARGKMTGQVVTRAKPTAGISVREGALAEVQTR